jgi:hypothetical protein
MVNFSQDASNVTGINGLDIVSFNDITLDGVEIGLASQESSMFSNDPYLDGIFGLGFSSLSVYDGANTRPSIVEMLKQTGKIDKAIVSIWLGRTVGDDGGGEVVSKFISSSYLKFSFNNTFIITFYLLKRCLVLLTQTIIVESCTIFQ